MAGNAAAGGVGGLQDRCHVKMAYTFVYNFIPLNFIVLFPVETDKGTEQT
ncbi:hypothetical protein GCM10023093_00580 [Nemorincola caseinilytica]|uniref:Uncharacterized protein n=1 Tax=Nemorincola caseinilytica TaxID=2054315 RepID=A0ABP8N576_9BACT